ncbi:MAG TPA: MGMT family protein [Bryobacteraceae bacterium]|nr:MGMT family protein [Bryobacteraceae bacterium]
MVISQTLHWHGGLMFEHMLATVRRIPKGKVATYGDVAAASGYPGAARQVVWALRSGGKAVPWHRVLGARGKILLPGENGFEQRLRLRAEGVAINGDRVDLKKHGHAFNIKR